MTHSSEVRRDSRDREKEKTKTNTPNFSSFEILRTINKDSMKQKNVETTSENLLPIPKTQRR